MKTPYVVTYIQVFVTAVATATFLVCCAFASTAVPGPPRHKDLIDRLDRVVEARFQAQDSGKFGMVRMIEDGVIGHRSEDYLLSDESPAEHAALSPIWKSPNKLIVAIMHLRHRPGRLEGKKPPESWADPKPSAQLMEVSGTTDEDASATYDWAYNNINKASLWAADSAKRGQAVYGTYGKYSVAIRPIRATHDSCLGCHVGTKKNAVVGAMIYMFAPTQNGKLATETWIAGD